MTLFLLSLAFIAIAMLVMAVGVLFKRPCLRGSCGGPTIFDRDGDPLSCDACPRRKKREAQAAAERAASPLPTVR